jgi:hypothetical protein
LRGPASRATITLVESGAEPPIYRTEVLAIIGALSDLVVEVRAIHRLLENEDGEETEDDA